MTICDRCCAPNASRTYVEINVSGLGQIYTQKSADLCDRCRPQLAAMVESFFQTLPQVAPSLSRESSR
jgi:hypothetical protein